VKIDVWDGNIWVRAKGGKRYIGVSGNFVRSFLINLFVIE
jgi:hypothetical protein